jgi:hypothetical protein
MEVVMDTLLSILAQSSSLLTGLSGKYSFISLIVIIICGAISLFLPRRLTVKYGMLIYKAVGTIFLQKRATFLKINDGLWSRVGTVLRTTFVDLSYGVYLASREDLKEEEIQQRIEGYINLHKTLAATPAAPETTVPPAPPTPTAN